MSGTPSGFSNRLLCDRPLCARSGHFALANAVIGLAPQPQERPRHVVELGPFGAKPHKPELSLDLVDLASLCFAGFGPTVDALAIELRDANSGIGIKVGVAAAFIPSCCACSTA
jgi:hypothetical protein